MSFAFDLASVAIDCFKTVFCVLPGNTTIFLPSKFYLWSSGGSSSPFIYTPSLPPSSPSTMVSSLSSSSSDITRLSFGIIPTFIPQRLGKALWIVQDIHPLFPPLGFVTAATTPVLIIFTSCSRYYFSIYVGSKGAILHSLFLNYFNVNMLHARSCPFSLSKPFILGSW